VILAITKLFEMSSVPIPVTAAYVWWPNGEKITVKIINVTLSVSAITGDNRLKRFNEKELNLIRPVFPTLTAPWR
jgi:hypothetical protein